MVHLGHDATMRKQNPLPPDEAASLLNAILAGDKLEKLDELEQKVNQVLELRNGNG